MEVRLENIVKRLDNRPVLEGINLVIPKGKCVGLVGPNGAGKTTLIRILLGMYNCGGKVLYNNKVREHIKIVDEKIMFILDASNLFYKLSVSENIEFYVRAYNRGLSKAKIREKTGEILDKINLLEYSRESIMKLSRGMRQRLCIGRTMVTKPEFIVLDEPYIGLDVESQLFLTDYLFELKKTDTTILLSSHDLEHIGRLCDSIAFIKKGKILDVCDMNEKVPENVEDMYRRIVIKR